MLDKRTMMDMPRTFEQQTMALVLLVMSHQYDGAMYPNS